MRSFVADAILEFVICNMFGKDLSTNLFIDLSTSNESLSNSDLKRKKILPAKSFVSGKSRAKINDFLKIRG